MRRKRERRPGPQSCGSQRERWRRGGRILLGVLGVAVASACLIYADVRREGRPVYLDVRAVPTMPVAIVFGAGIGNAVINDRVETGIALYKAGKVRKLLMTGDNGRVGYDEPGAMKAQAVTAGVPTEDVVCDYAGFRTYDSLYRARDVFGVHRAVLVTQGYHLPRALFLARRLGLTTVGMDAARHSYGGAQRWWDLREIGAVETAWLDVSLRHRRPKFLGPKEPLFGRSANDAKPG